MIVSLVACKSLWGGDDEEYNPFHGMTAQQLFDEANNSLSAKEYSKAIKRLEALDTMYPFNDYAERAQMSLIYAYYQKEEYAAASATAERFIHLYPRAKRVDYAYYMKGMADFKQARGALATMLPMNESWRDPGTTSQAYSDFATLIQRFPDSKYKANALQRMIYLRNMFAQREMNTAAYYYSRKMYVAAADRASYLLTTYPQASCAKNALTLLYRANLALGLKQAAADAATVYRATYHANPGAVIIDSHKQAS